MGPYSKDVAKEFALQRLRLTPATLGKSRDDLPAVVSSIGGLQDGGHKIELLNRFENFRARWFDYWYENHTLIAGHVLRGALRIVNVDEYPYYFKATRKVARRRAAYHRCPRNLTAAHFEALKAVSKYGPFTPSEFDDFLGAKHSLPKGRAKALLYELYNYGRVARIGKRRNRPLYYVLEKLPYELDMQISENDAEKWLFLKCLSIYGPFRLEDIAHWVGWTLNETRRISKILLHEKAITGVRVEGLQETCFVRTDDLSVLDSLAVNLPEHSFIRILFNDDALLLGYYKRLESDFGYDWRYPQFSEGIVWRAAILYGKQIIGEATLDMHVKSPNFVVKSLTLLEKAATSEITSKIQEELQKHSNFHDKTLEMTEPTLI